MQPGSEEYYKQKCETFILIEPKIQWFIRKYFGEHFLQELSEIARRGEGPLLFDRCNMIWYELPDNLFNIRENPPGWSDFLSLLED